MAYEFTLPELGENVEGGTLTQLLVSEGDTLKKDQAVMELETEKAVIEVPIDRPGKIQKILVSEGDEVSVGQKILTLESADSGEGNSESEQEKTEKPSEEGSKDRIDSRAETPEPEKKDAENQEKENPDEGKAGKAEKKSSAKQKPGKSAGGPSSKTVFKLPELGENVTSGTVTNILVSQGDTVKADQNILELETEKAVIEVPVDTAGKITKILIKEGDEIEIGQEIVEISGEDVSEEAPEEDVSEEQPEEPAEKEEAEEEPAGESETVEEKPAEPSEKQKPSERREKKAAVPAAPSVRRFAREIGIQIEEVPGTGPSGRISIEDIKNYARTVNTRQEARGTIFKGVAEEALPDFSKWGEIDRQPMNKVREKTAAHLGFAWATIPHVTQFDKADITELEESRKEFGKQVEAAGGKLTVTAILLKIVAAAMKKFPQFNASIDMENSEIIFKKYINIGIAVDTDRGLLVPVVRQVDQKNITQLSVELGELAKKARDRKLSLEEMQGGNFSISNLGGIGGTAFTPVVNSPEPAILGVSRSEIQPVYISGQFEPRLMLPLSLSYDHRLIDGADAARFLRWVAEALEKPLKVLLDG